MIDRIDNNNYYGTYSHVGRKKINTQEFSKTFDGEISSKSNQDAESDQNEGVKLDLSSNAQVKEVAKNTPTATSQNESSIATSITFEQIKSTVRSFVNLLKETWKTIWEDNSNSKIEKSDLSEGETSDLNELSSSNESYNQTTDNYEKNGMFDQGLEKNLENRDIEKVLKTKDINQLTAMITNNGKLKLAKNSQLLTTYDRQGKLVNLDGTQKERILHGDRNLMKL